VTKDDLGVPVARLTFNYHENEQKIAAHVVPNMKEILRHGGASEVWGTDTPFPQFTHCYGGTIMGTDPETSVVNKYGISREAPNLAIHGGSTFVTTTGCNPTMTIEALARYGAEHDAKNFESLAA
jgi:choline dehydrogenase-like flavoprotein